MKQESSWGRRFVGGLAALVLLAHCGSTEAEQPQNMPPEVSQEVPRETPPQAPQETPSETPPETPSETPSETPPAAPAEEGEAPPAPTDCMARDGEAGTSYCTYRGAGGGCLGWVRSDGGTGPEQLQALTTDAAGGIVVAGQFGDTPFPEGTGFALARYTSEGVPLWTRWVTSSAAEVTALTVTPQGYILAVGRYGGWVDLGKGPLPQGSGGLDWSTSLFIAVFSPDGQTVWAKGFVASYERDGQLEIWPIHPRAIATDAQGSLIIAGAFYGVMDLGGGPMFAGNLSVPSGFDAVSSGFLAKFSLSGQHLWSRNFLNGPYTRVSVRSASMATDSVGNVLVGGFAHSDTDLGDGRVGDHGPFIARYDGAGNLLWKRIFPGLHGEVARVQPLGADGVAFLGDFVGTFTFAGQTYIAGSLSWPGGVWDTRAFVGTLSSTQGDGWLRALGDYNSVWELITDGQDTLTVSGQMRAMDLGGGVLGAQRHRPFIARYGRTGEHRWSRVLDGNLEPHRVWGTGKSLQFFMAPQLGGAVVIGSYFTSPVQVDGQSYTSRGASDLLYFQLGP